MELQKHIEQSASSPSLRKPYQSPTLTNHGSVQEQTQNGTNATMDGPGYS